MIEKTNEYIRAAEFFSSLCITFLIFVFLGFFQIRRNGGIAWTVGDTPLGRLRNSGIRETILTLFKYASNEHKPVFVKGLEKIERLRDLGDRTNVDLSDVRIIDMGTEFEDVPALRRYAR